MPTSLRWASEASLLAVRAEVVSVPMNYSIDSGNEPGGGRASSSASCAASSAAGLERPGAEGRSDSRAAGVGGGGAGTVAEGGGGGWRALSPPSVACKGWVKGPAREEDEPLLKGHMRELRGKVKAS